MGQSAIKLTQLYYWEKYRHVNGPLKTFHRWVLTLGVTPPGAITDEAGFNGQCGHIIT